MMMTKMHRKGELDVMKGVIGVVPLLVYRSVCKDEDENL